MGRSPERHYWNDVDEASACVSPYFILISIAYGIIILFFSLAYLCLSLEMTGIFDWIGADGLCILLNTDRPALKAIMATKATSNRLFITFGGLTAVLTIFTSNDVRNEFPASSTQTADCHLDDDTYHRGHGQLCRHQCCALSSSAVYERQHLVPTPRHWSAAPSDRPLH